MTAIIIDDELDAIDILRSFVKEFCPEVHIVDTAQSIDEALEKVESNNPDFLLLDIQLIDGTGFDLLNRLSQEQKVIFTTAYDQYAVKAFRHAAVDYLLKPINPLQLKEAIRKIQKTSILEENRLQQLSQSYYNQKFESITIATAEEYIIIKIEDIMWCEADVNYTKIFLLSQDHPIVVATSLKEYEEMLPDTLFFRSHQSYLVNLSHISKFVKADGGYILMSSGKSIPVSRRKKTEFLRQLGIK